jgi:hypothetical protein
MDFKIIETGTKYPDVLVARGRDENGCETVGILTIGILDGEPNMFAEEVINFENHESARQFIKDYSLESANKWCERQEILYEKFM